MALPPEPIPHACDSYGILLRREAITRGIDDNALARLVAAKVLVRMRHGAYCLRSVWRAADEGERHRLLSRGIMRQYDHHVALSHASSCVAQRGPTYGLDLSHGHITHLDGGGRQTSKLTHHLGECRVGDIRRQDGHWLTVPARAVLEVACTDGVEASLVQANHFLHTEETTVEQLRAAYQTQTFWPHSLRQHPVLLLADPRIESVGESRCIYCFFTQGLPAPEPQYEVCHPDGTVAARVDFAWPRHRLIVEFDGREKYHRLRRPGESIENAVMREKAREDLIRRLTGWTVIRVTWADLDHPVHLANRIRLAMAVAA